MERHSETRQEQLRNAQAKYRAKRSVDFKRIEIFLDKKSVAALHKQAVACGRGNRFNVWLARWIEERALS